MVLSSVGGRLGGLGGGLGSTWPAATKDEITDKRAEEAHSNQGVDDVDQHLVNNWRQASNGCNNDEGGLHEVFRRWEAFSSM